MRRLYDQGRLDLSGSVAELNDARCFTRLLSHLYQRNWVVYAKRPFGGAEQVFRYLGQYTHRVAISNRRLVALHSDRVSFRYRDSADQNQTKIMSLQVEEFIRRFLLHVLPTGFVRIRHYGLLASANVASKLQRCRQLLTEEDSSTPSQRPSWVEQALQSVEETPPQCPRCRSVLIRTHLTESEQGSQKESRGSPRDKPPHKEDPSLPAPREDSS